jgi:hypothetical protein
MTDTTKTIAELLQPCLPDGPQNTIAMEWLRRWEESGGKKLSPATVESRMSDLLAERDRGVRFFFSEPSRTAILVDALGLEPSVREELTRRAEEILERGGRRAPRTVLDLSTFPGDWTSAEALFRSIKADLLGETHMLPMVMIVLEDQYDRLPRSFDDLGKSLEYVKVASAEEGREVVEERIDGEATVLSGWMHRPYHRWLAIEFDGTALHYGPPGGLAQLKERGRLPAPFTVEHTAEELLDGPVKIPKARLPSKALALRKIVDQVGNPKSCSELGTLEERIAIAKELGLKAAYTDEEHQIATQRRERVQIEKEVEEAIASLPKGHKKKPRKATQEDLDNAIGKARRVGIEPTVLRVGDTIHVVTGGGVAPSRHPRLEIHSIERAPNALELLLGAVESMTLDDWRDDPLLLATIKRLAGGDPEQRKLLLHARATVLLGAKPVPAKPTPLADWREPLKAMLKGDPPAAQLHFDVQLKPAKWIGARCDLTPVVFPDGRMFLKELEDVAPLYWVPPLATPLMNRTEQLHVFFPKQMYESSYNDHYRQSGPAALVPITEELARSHERWLEFAEASPWLGGSVARALELSRDNARYLMPPRIDPWNKQIVALGHLWPQADLELAAAWLVLRRAVHDGDATRLHDGRVLLELGGGILAVIEARQHGENSEASVASLRLPLMPDAYEKKAEPGPMTTKVDTHIAVTQYEGTAVTRLGFSFPHGMMIRGGGAVYEIVFQAPPLMVATSGGRAGEVGIAAGAATVVQAAEDEDDY